MRLIRNAIGVLVVIQVIVCGDTSILTMRQAVQLAVTNHYDILRATHQNTIAATDYSLGNAGLLPSIALSGTVSQSRGESTVTNASGTENVIADAASDSRNINIGLQYTLFKGFYGVNRYRQLGLQVDKTVLKVTYSMETVMMDVVNSYLQWVTADKERLIVVDSAKIAMDRLKQAKTQAALGTITQTDVLIAQSDVDQELALLREKERQVRYAVSVLSDLLGDDGLITRNHEAYVAIPPTLNMATLRMHAASRNTGLLLVRQDKQLTDTAIKMAKSAISPSVSWKSTYSHSSNESDVSLYSKTSTQGWQHQLSLTIPLFEGFKNIKSLKRSKLESDIASLNIDQVKQELDYSITRVFDLYQVRLLQEADYARMVDILYQSFRRSQAQYQLGQITWVELNEVKQLWKEAQFKQLNVRKEALLATFDLYRLSGQLIQQF